MREGRKEVAGEGKKVASEVELRRGKQEVSVASGQAVPRVRANAHHHHSCIPFDGSRKRTDDFVGVQSRQGGE